MFGGGGGGTPKVVQQAAPPTPEDPNVQKARAASLTQDKYARGFMSTIQSMGNQGGSTNLGNSSIASGPNAVGSVQKLG
jgi:hypothetical protein